MGKINFLNRFINFFSAMYNSANKKELKKKLSWMRAILKGFS